MKKIFFSQIFVETNILTKKWVEIYRKYFWRLWSLRGLYENKSPTKKNSFSSQKNEKMLSGFKKVINFIEFKVIKILIQKNCVIN